MKKELTAVILDHPLNTMVETHMVSVGGFHICRWADLVALASELTTLRALVAAADVIQFPKTSYPGLGGVPYIKANGDGTFKAGRAWKGHYQERDSVSSLTEAYQWIAEDEAFEALREK